MARVKHIALVKFKQGTTEEQIAKIFDEILDMTESIPEIEDYVAGPNSSPEGLTQGYTHGFIMTFKDAAARDSYLANPERTRLKANHQAHIESVSVFDFEI